MAKCTDVTMNITLTNDTEQLNDILDRLAGKVASHLERRMPEDKGELVCKFTYHESDIASLAAKVSDATVAHIKEMDRQGRR